MEGADIKICTKRLFGSSAHAFDCHHAEIVTQSLARPTDIANKLGYDHGVGKPRIRCHVVPRLIVGPAFRMNAHIYHHPSRTKRKKAPHAKKLVGRFIDTHLDAQPLFAIKCPGVSISDGISFGPEWRTVRIFGGK